VGFRVVSIEILGTGDKQEHLRKIMGMRVFFSLERYANVGKSDLEIFLSVFKVKKEHINEWRIYGVTGNVCRLEIIVLRFGHQADGLLSYLYSIFN
jgi:hypothetical protein